MAKASSVARFKAMHGVTRGLFYDKSIAILCHPCRDAQHRFAAPFRCLSTAARHRTFWSSLSPPFEWASRTGHMAVAVRFKLSRNLAGHTKQIVFGCRECHGRFKQRHVTTAVVIDKSHHFREVLQELFE